MGELQAWAMLAAPVVLYLLWELYGIWLDTRPYKIKAVFFDESKRVMIARVNLNSNGKTFSMSSGMGSGKNRKGKYHVVESCIYRTGLWRVPTSYYKLGDADPIDQIKLASASTLTAQDFHEATEAHVAQDIIESFSQPMFTITTSMMIVIGVVAIANAILYVQLNSKLDEISAALGIVSNGG